MIEFSSSFTEESGEYILLDLPAELRKKLDEERELKIQEHRNDSYIIGDEKLYQVIKFQISNMMLLCEQRPEPVSEKEKLVVRSFQQSTLIPTAVRPFSREIMQHLRIHHICRGEPSEKPQLKVETIMNKFVTSEKFLAKVGFWLR